MVARKLRTMGIGTEHLEGTVLELVGAEMEQAPSLQRLTVLHAYALQALCPGFLALLHPIRPTCGAGEVAHALAREGAYVRLQEGCLSGELEPSEESSALPLLQATALRQLRLASSDLSRDCLRV